MSHYMVKIPLRDMTLAQAKYISGEIYDAIDQSDTIPGSVSNVFLTQDEITDNDEQVDAELDNEYSDHYTAGRNENPLPDDFPKVD